MAVLRQGKARPWQARASYPAVMRQLDPSRSSPPPYLPALDALEAEIDDLAAAVARDVTRSAAPAEADLALAREAVTWLLGTLRRGAVPGAAALRPLREDAAREARAGRPLQPVLDRTLSAGWVLWAAATRRSDLPAPALAALGEALLRTGDAAAAVIADAHATAERELAARSASALRELLDELLELDEADEVGRARLVRRTGELGLAADRPLSVVVVDAGRDLQDGDPAVVAVARSLAQGAAPAVGDPRALGGPLPGPVTAATRGRLVVLAPVVRRGPDVAAALRNLGQDWVAVSAPAADLLQAAAAAREATAALAVAVRLRLSGRITEASSLLLERLLLSEPVLLRAAVERELGPLEGVPRSGGLLATLEAYLAERENVRAAARRLGVAPRTVAYRLERVERLLGGPLDADRRLRLAAALFARRLLAAPERPGLSRGAAAGRPR